MSQWQDPEILFFCYKSILRKIRSHAETPYAWSHGETPYDQFRPDLSVCLRDIAEKLVPAKLKPIVGCPQLKIIVILSLTGLPILPCLTFMIIFASQKYLQKKKKEVVYRQNTSTASLSKH